MLRYYKCCQ